MASHQLNGIIWDASITTAGVTMNGSCFPVRQPHNAPHGGFHKWGCPKMNGDGKSYQIGWFKGTLISGNPHMESYLSLPTSELLDGLVFSFGRRDGQDIWCVKRLGFSSSNLNFTGYRKHEARVVGRSNLPWEASILAEIGKVVDTGGLNQLRSGDTWCGSPGDLQWPHFVKGLYQVHNLTLQRQRAKCTKSLTSADWPTGPSSDCACLCLSSSFFSLLSRMKCLKCPQTSKLSGSHPVSTIELVERPLGATRNLADIFFLDSWTSGALPRAFFWPPEVKAEVDSEKMNSFQLPFHPTSTSDMYNFPFISKVRISKFCRNQTKFNWKHRR